MARTTINFEAEIHVVERSERFFTATIMPFHVSGYSDTFDGSIERAVKGLSHLFKAYGTDGNLFRFLDESKVEYTAERENAIENSPLPMIEEQVEKAYDDFGADLLRLLNESNTECDDTAENSSEQWVKKQFEYAGSH